MPTFDRSPNKTVISVPNTALGTALLTQAEYEAPGFQGVSIFSDQDIAIVDGTAAGTYANSPWRIPANTTAIINKKAGPLKAIASSATASVAVAPFYGHP